MYPDMFEFFEKYTFDNSVASEVFDPDDEPGQFETYGKDIEHVIKVADQNPKRVWTLVDGENDDLLLLNGFHYVNRIHYYITNEDGDGETYAEGLGY